MWHVARNLCSIPRLDQVTQVVEGIVDSLGRFSREPNGPVCVFQREADTYYKQSLKSKINCATSEC